VKASALGLVPELEDLLALDPPGFEVVKFDDQGVSVAKFDEDSPETAVVSERTWLVTLRARPGQQPHTFHFGTARVEDAKMTYQRYQDADLVSAKEEVDLEQAYGRRSRAWLWWAGAAAVGVLVLVGAVVVLLRRRKPAEGQRFRLPERLTPFTVLGLLREIRQNNGLAEAQQKELEQSIARLERHYFADDGNGATDLKALAEDWVRRAR
jgi:hypothetical protein